MNDTFIKAAKELRSAYDNARLLPLPPPDRYSMPETYMINFATREAASLAAALLKHAKIIVELIEQEANLEAAMNRLENLMAEFKERENDD